MALGPGSIAFVGINTAGGPDDWIAFVALDAIPAGTVIYLTDNELANPTSTAFNTGESFTKWTAPAEGVAAGTIVTLTSFDIAGGPVANIGAVSALAFSGSANRGFSQTADSVYAYLANADATADTPTVHLARINLGNAADGSIPETLGANQQVSFTSGQEGALYNGSHSGQANFSDFLNLINDPANWTLVAGTTPITSLDATNFSTSAAAPVLQSIAPVVAAQAEGSNGATTNFDFTVTLSAAAVADTIVSLSLTGEASDFTAIPPSVTILAGNTSAVATFGVSADTTVEPNEDFTVTATLDGVDKQAVATIINDDGVANAGVDLSTYVRVGRFDLPEPTRTTPPVDNLLAQEASGVAYNFDTDTLFIVGDGGKSVTQVSKTGVLIDTMTLALGSSPQGTDFYDPEGITYIGGGQFVMTEERDRQLVKFTYAPGTTLSRADVQTVKLGTFVDNTGLEGLSFDPQTNGFIVVKEISPQGIFQTDVDFALGTATNGSPTTENSINLFDPDLANLLDFADVFALSNLPSLSGESQSGNLLVLSQASGKIVNIDRSGNISSSLQIAADPGSPLSVPDHQHEGITMDHDGNIYIVNENGGGDIDHPQLWVYAPSLVPNQAPTAVALNNAITSILENSTTVAPIKVADIVVTDDGLGTNNLSVTGTDASFFELAGSSLFLKAGTVLDHETKVSYSVDVNVDDPTLGSTPDATANFTLSVTDVVDETPVVPFVFISEVHPSGSGNSAYAADWFEITNAGSSAVDITGWQMDDNSNGTGKVALRGVTSIPAGESAIFFEGTADGATDAAIIANFSTAWFGSATPPAGFLIGAYGGSGVGLSTGGDAVNLFDAAGERIAGVSFGTATTGVTFDNHAGLNNVALPLPTVSTLSAAGTHGAFVSANTTETGSPGTTGNLVITEVAPWSSGDSPVAADWFEVTNTGATAADITGWRMDDNSQSFVGAVALNGITSIAPGESVIFLESDTPSATTASFLSNWFGTAPPPGLQIGTYTGSGVGLSTTNDAVNLYDSTGALQASVTFGASPENAPFATFDNAAGLNNAAISQLSAPGIDGAFVAASDADEIGSPGRILSAAVTAIHDIQGSGQTSPLAGQVVTTRGVVIAVDTNGSRGYYIQDPNADADSNTSEGILVFTNSAPLPLVGHLVEVSGTVQEFLPNGAALGSLPTTQINVTDVGGVVGSVVDLGVSPNAITATIIGGPGGLLPPTENLTDGSNFFESLEGMLVTVTNPIVVGARNNFGEIYTVVDSDADPSNGVNATGLTSRGNLLLSPGTPVFGDNSSQGPGGDFNPERIQIDDDNGVLAGFASPAVDVGARLNSVTGIVNYDFGNYQIVPTQVFTVAQASTLVKETTSLVGDADHLTVVAYNAENLDPNDPAARFTTIADEIINALHAPDIIALQEIQDNNGAVGGLGSPVTAADVTLGNIVSAITTAGGPTYAFLDNPFIGDDTNGGEPGGNIRVAFLYRADRVDFVEGSLRTVAANGATVSDPAGNTDQHTNPDNPFFTSRPPLAATFTFNDEEVTVVNNHFTSKGGSAALFGSDQPPFNAGEVQRAAQSQAVNTFVDNLLTADPDAKIVVAGDLNEFPFEEPMQVLKGAATISNYDVPANDPFFATATITPGGTQVLHDLLETLPANEQFDYVFEGNSQTLDHVFVTEGLQAGAQFDVVRINAEFAVQTSDHEPLVASLHIPAAAPFTLQLLHLSDSEAGLLASSTAPNLAALVDAFDDDFANTIIMSGGDNFLPGPFLAGGTDLSIKPVLNAVSGSTISPLATVNAPIAAVDIAILNEIGVRVSTIGNHEFDLGSRVFRDAFTPNSVPGWVGANFAYLSANLDFSGDADLNPRFTNTLDGGTGTLIPDANTLKGRVAPSVVINQGGEKIGFVGATTQLLEQISSPNGTEVKGFPTGAGPNGEVDDMTLLAAQLQPIINELIAEGVNKIIVQSHLQQIANEQLLATKLTGVDIILAGGSNTRLGDADDAAVAFPSHEANFAGNYPLQVTDAGGKTTLIVNTDSEFTYLGRLVVEFDQDGNIILDSLADNLAINGAYASTAENVAEAWATTVDNLETTAFAEGTKGEEVRDLTDAVQGVINAKDAAVFGHTTVYLEGERLIVRNQETNLGDITADANALAAQEALDDVPFLFSLKNGGGIRAQIGTISDPDPIDGSIDKLPPPANPAAISPEFPNGKPEGGISQLDIENSLRFDNRLMVFDTTPEGLLRILNWGAGLPANNGGFPQIGGVKFSFDPAKPGNDGANPGSRVVNVALINEQGELIAKVVENGVVLPTAPALISVVALNFTANGGDGYPIKTMKDAATNTDFLATNFRYLLNDGTLSAPIDRSLDFTAPANVPNNALGEQTAFANYLEERHGTPELAYDQADTPASEDLRIENLSVRSDAVFENLAPQITGDLAITVGEGDAVVITTADLNEADPDNSGFVLNYTVTATSNGKVLHDGVETTQFNQTDLDAGLVSFEHDGSATTAASFTVALTDAGGLTSGPATVQVAVTGVTLSGTPGADILNGSAHDDTLNGLAGNDVLNGLAGNDTMNGGPGNDTYDVDSAGDVVIEAAGAGTDLVLASVSHTLAAEPNVENLTLTGAAAINGTGNVLANTLTGNSGNNVLDGGIGNDMLIGGTGDDVLNGGADNDALVGGVGNDVLNGGAGSDKLDGGAGDDILVGDDGNDTLTPGLGADVIRYATALSASNNVDKILGFLPIDDSIQLDNAIFTKLLTEGALSTDNFRASAGGTAADANDYILYSTNSGALSYDADGSGLDAAIPFVTLLGVPLLAAADFVVT